MLTIKHPIIEALSEGDYPSEASKRKIWMCRHSVYIIYIDLWVGGMNVRQLFLASQMWEIKKSRFYLGYVTTLSGFN